MRVQEWVIVFSPFLLLPASEYFVHVVVGATGSSVGREAVELAIGEISLWRVWNW